MSLNNFLIVPLSGAAIGYFTNWLAIKMLFRPHEEKRLFGLILPFTPGIIPKERQRLAAKVGETISAHVLTGEALSAAVTSQETLERIESVVSGLFETTDGGEQVIDRAINAVFGEKWDVAFQELVRLVSEALAGLLPKLGPALEKATQNNPRIMLELKGLLGKIVDDNAGPIAAMFINKDKLADRVKTSVLAYLNDEANQAELTRRLEEWLRENLLAEARLASGRLTPESLAKMQAGLLSAIKLALEKGARHVAESLPIGRIVEEQINALGLPEGEKIILSVLKRELNAITAIGGVLGFVIGVATVLLGRI